MSTFDILESSLESSVPIEVYRFVIGAETFLYTSTEDTITIGTDVYQPMSIERGPVTQGLDDRSRLVEVTLPMLNEFAVRYLAIVPGQKASVTITALQRNESPAFNTQVVRFRGKVRSVRFTDDEHAIVGCQSLEAAQARTIPNYSYSGQCNHILYGAACGASTIGHTLSSALVTAVSGTTITVQGLAASGLDFKSGYCKPTGADDYRMVLTQSGDTITLLLPFFASPLGQTVDVFEGCDHLLNGDCETKFGRSEAYGGFWFVPDTSPFLQGLS